MIEMCIGRHEKYPLLLSDFNETWIYKEIFEKYSSIKFHENPTSGSRVVAYGRTDGRTDGRTNMTKLIVVFRNFANAPKNALSIAHLKTRPSK
jgi:hypothetical protein